MTRADRWLIRPIANDWTDPVTANRRSSSAFRVKWDDALVDLRDEVDKIDGEYPVVIQIDVAETDLRADGMLRSRAHVGDFPGVIVSFRCEFGPLRLASDAYESRWLGGLTSWQANVRAITLTLKALRDLDRWGVSKRGQQYTGWKAIEAPRNGEFADVTAAADWMRKYATLTLNVPLGENTVDGKSGGWAGLYRSMSRRMHPDTGSPAADWHRLDEARRKLKEADWL